ncbi:MAG: hypothetical protein NZO58_14130, partial [Gemmataceae bacterium]|nr:hypothetical protein [Gemmataceae bacterium]
MSTPAVQSRTCPICGHALSAEDHNCSTCGANEEWLELGEAFAFVRRRFQEWHADRRISPPQWQRINHHYADLYHKMHAAIQERQTVWTGVGYAPKNQCWNCRDYETDAGPHCRRCGVVVDGPAVRSLRAWKLLAREIQKHREQGWLSLYQAHQLETDVNERMAALRVRLQQNRVYSAAPVDRPKEPKPAEPRRSFLEILVDPHTIQWLLAAGGA